MSLAPWKIISIGLIPVVGIGIAYPLVSNYRNKTKIELKTLEDFKKYCLVLVKGRENKQLLTCPVTNNSSETSFYFYEEGSNEGEQIPQKIQKIEIKEGKITFTLEKEAEEIKMNNSGLNALTNKDLLKECQVNWQSEEIQRKLICSNQEISQKLEEFK